MTQRITSSMQDNQILANINNDLAALDNTQNEISSGLTIQQPSDNPYGAALVLQLQGQISQMNGYSSNVNDGTAWTNIATASLQSIQQMAQRVSELVVESENGTMSQQDLNDTAAEVDQLTDQIKQEADAQYNGQYVFAGTATGTMPYQAGANDAYQGNTGSVLRQIGPGTVSTVQVNSNLSSVLGSGPAAADGGLLDTLRTISQDLTSGNRAGLGNDLTNINANVQSLEQLQSVLGATQDRLQMASTRITSTMTTDQTQLGNTEDVDMAQAALQFSTEQAGYSAALQSGAAVTQQSLMNFLTNA
jgi:flagellar hook-associated protein 3 FlgL